MGKITGEENGILIKEVHFMFMLPLVWKGVKEINPGFPFSV